MKKKILWFLTSVFIVFLILFAVLKIGFSLDSIQTHIFSIDELYIKLDKKLTIKAKKVEIFDKKNQDEALGLNDISQDIARLKYLYFFFQEIDIQNLHIKGHDVALLFKDDEFVADNDFMYLKLNLGKSEQNISADVKELVLKGVDANISANINIDTKQESYVFNAKANSDKLRFDFNLTYDNKHLEFKFDKLTVKNMREIFAFLDKNTKINKKLSKWVGQRAVAKLYHFDYIQAKVDFGKNTTVSELSGLGFASDLVVKLDENITGIQIPYVDINLSKEKLDFNFDKASFNGKDLSASKVYLYDITQPKKVGIWLHIVSNELLLDEKMQELLKVYNITIPFVQDIGTVMSDFNLSAPFSDLKKMTYSGNFQIENSHFITANLSVQKGKVLLEKGKVLLDGFKIKNDFLEADFNASIDLVQKSGVFDTELFKLYFKDILNLPKQSLKLDLSYKNGVFVEAKALNLKLNFSNGLSFNLLKPEKFKEYSPIMQEFDIQSIENLAFETKDFKEYIIKLTKAYFKSDLLVRSDGKAYDNDDFTIRKKDDLLEISNSSTLFNFSLRKNNIKIRAKNLFYRVKNSSKADKINYNIELKGSNFGVLLDDLDKSLHFDEVDFSSQKGNVKLQANKGQTSFELKKNSKEFLMNINNISDTVANDFFRKKMFQNGVFSVHIQGESEKNYKGRILINDTFMKELKIHNQLISFIDAIPSLALFKAPTFNEKGLNIQKGAILFERTKDNIHISALTFDGDSVDVLGSGNIDLNKSTINIKLELQTLKSASQIIDKIPIINQVILGTDRVISTQILVSGNLDKPQFRSQIIKEAIQLPFNLLKNIIEMPSTWFK